MKEQQGRNRGRNQGPQLKIIDTHCHFSLCKHVSVSEHVALLREASIAFSLDPGLDPDDIAERLKLFSKYPEILVGGALAPHYLKGLRDEDIQRKLDLLEKYAKLGRLHAIAEIGLDIVEHCQPLEKQKDLLKAQLRLAEKYKLPAVLHLRRKIPAGLRSREQDQAQGYPNPYTEAAALLKEEAITVPIIAHCFSGSLADAESMIKAGAFISFSGILTFPKSDELREIAKTLPLEKILLETDAPFLAPQPVRGKPNISPYVLHTLDHIQKLRSEEASVLAKQIFENSCQALQLET